MSDDEIEKKAQELAEEVAGWSKAKLGGQMRSSSQSWRERHLFGVRRWLRDNPERRSMIGELGRVSAKKRYDDPVVREKLVADFRKRRSTPEFISAHKESIQKQKHPVVREEDHLIFLSVGDTGNGKGSSIVSNANGRTLTAYGYHWRFASDKEREWFWSERELRKTDGPFSLPDEFRVCRKLEKSTVGAHRKRQIVCVEQGIIWQSGAEASRAFDMPPSYISLALTGRKKTAYGHHWRYATPEEVKWFWSERERTGADGPFQLPTP